MVPGRIRHLKTAPYVTSIVLAQVCITVVVNVQIVSTAAERENQSAAEAIGCNRWTGPLDPRFDRQILDFECGLIGNSHRAAGISIEYKALSHFTRAECSIACRSSIVRSGFVGAIPFCFPPADQARGRRGTGLASGLKSES